jgi:hypothetical protein
MGYGGFFKKIVRIAVPMAVSFVGGPLATAISSAAITGATGGSFKESLMAGATSYIGSQVSQGINQSIAGSAIPAGKAYAPNLIDPGVDAFASTNLTGGFQPTMAFTGPLDATGEILRNVNDAVTGGVTDATNALGLEDLGAEIVGGVKTLRTPFDFFQTNQNIPLLGGALKGLGQSAPNTLLGSLAGGATTMTLNQALLANTPEADALLAENGYTPELIVALKQEARNAMSQEAFDRLIADVQNPGLSQEEFNKVLASGIERENVALGPDITEQQFKSVFDDPNLGRNILSSEEGLRKQAFGQDISAAFPGDAFQSLDDNIIDSIVQERQGPAQQQISRFGARGNLNPTGGKTANQFIQSQVPQAQETVRQVGEGVLGGYQANVQDVRDRAEQQASGYKLGDELFDVTPFSTERSGLVEQQQGQLGSDVRGALGSEPLFDVSGALQSAGRAQGVVSGQGQNQSFLDSIAARELGSTSSRNRRGLRSRGSGAF